LALESLAGSHQVEQKCQHCGKVVGTRTAANKDEARRILNGFGSGVTDAQFDRWWNKLRNSVFHGGKEPNSAFFSELRQASQVIINAVEHEVFKRVKIQSTGRSTISIVGELSISRHHFVEFQTESPEDEFASVVPSAKAIESCIDAMRNPVDDLGVEILGWKETESW
jgi:hypothetical protein